MEMEVSEQEQQLLEMIREQSGEDRVSFLLERPDGRWHVTIATPGREVSGTGTTFDQAWDHAGPRSGPFLTVVR